MPEQQKDVRPRRMHEITPTPFEIPITSTSEANTAISSSSSSANKGTRLSNSGLDVIFVNPSAIRTDPRQNSTTVR